MKRRRQASPTPCGATSSSPTASLPIAVAFLVLALAHSAAAEYAWCDGSISSWVNPKCYFGGPCAARTNPIEELRTLLETRFVGQRHATDTLLSMVQEHVEMRNSRHRRLISFHIAGDNGVGKTWVTKLLAEALFKDPSEGLVVLSGTNYKGADPDTVKQHQQALFNAVLAQLEKCPWSLIIIDEVQYVHSTTLQILQQFMDNADDFVVRPFDGKRIFKNGAMLGLLSDFGLEGSTPGKTFDEMEKFVRSHTAELWKDEKQAQLVRHTIPFTVLNDDDIELLVTQLIGEMPKQNFQGRVRGITLSKGVVHAMRAQIREQFPAENGRGVDKWLAKSIVPVIRRRLGDHKVADISIDYDGSDFAIAAKPFVGEIPGRKKEL